MPDSALRRKRSPDRQYEPDGTLRPRSHADSLLHDPAAAAAQALRIALQGEAVACNGSIVRIQAQTLCIHGDNPGAVAIARAVRRRLKQSAVRVCPWHSGPDSVSLDLEEWPSGLRRRS
jgi:UPF0271 protein